jgi:TolB protein
MKSLIAVFLIPRPTVYYHFFCNNIAVPKSKIITCLQGPNSKPEALKHPIVFTSFLLTLIFASCRQRYELAFVSDRSGKADIYLTDSDTSFFARMYTDDMMKHSPVWAHDGSALLFVAVGQWANDLAMAAPDGSDFRYLTRDPFLVAHPDYSPDGQYIVYMSDRDHPNGELYLMRPDGTIHKRLTYNLQTEKTPRFAPDGRRIVYTEELPHPPDLNNPNPAAGALYLTDTAGQPPILLYLSDELPGMASFSPDGKQVVFHEVRGEIGEIMVLDISKSLRYSLTAGDPDSRWPVWSPDGKWIAYVRRSNDNSDIWMMRADGSQKRALVVSPFRDEMPAFRPHRK